MNTDGIQTFLVILETRSLSKAAEYLHVTQSTVSHRLNALENELGFQLVIRKREQRFIELTNKGEEFIAIAERLMVLNKELLNLRNENSLQSLKIGCVETLNSVVFPSFYKTLYRTIPNLVLDISSHWSFVIYNLLQNQDIDVGFVLKEIQTRNVISEPIFEERMVLVYNPNYCEFPKTIHPSKLDPKDEILLSWSPTFQNWHDSWFLRSDNSYVKVDSSSLIRSFLIDSGHWTIVPISLARYYHKIYKLNIVELEDRPPNRVCYKITHRYPNPTRLKTIKQLDSTLKTFLSNPEFLQYVK